jgi:hypothetical protein
VYVCVCVRVYVCVYICVCVCVRALLYCCVWSVYVLDEGRRAAETNPQVH